MLDLTIRNARLSPPQTELSDIGVQDGVFIAVQPHIEVEARQAMDATGLFVTPALVESHVHLDTAMTAGQLQWNESGTLFEGIQRWSEHKALLTEQDVLERATAAVTREVVHGVLRESKK